MIKVFHPRGVKELFWKAGRTTEEVTFKRLLKKHPTQAKRALKVAQLKGVKKVQALGKRHGVEGLGAYTKGPKVKPSRYQKSFLKDDDPKRALKSMRLDREGSHMKGLPTEPRESFDPFMWKSTKFKKPIEIASPKKTTATFKHVIKRNIPIFKKGKQVGSTTRYSKAYGTFRVPSRKLGRARIATGQPTGKYVWRKGKKKKILLIE